MSEMYMSTRDAIDLLNEAQKKVKQRFPTSHITNHIQRQLIRELVLTIVHAVGHLAFSCIEEESK